MDFNELEKALPKIDEYVRYKELIEYIIEKRRHDSSYKEIIKNRIMDIINEYCGSNGCKNDLISSKSILESSSEYERVVRLKKLISSNSFESFINDIFKRYTAETNVPEQMIYELPKKCTNDLFGVEFCFQQLLTSSDNKYIGEPAILEKVYKYLTEKVLVNSSSASAIDNINKLQSENVLLNSALNKDEDSFRILAYMILKFMFEEELKNIECNEENKKENEEYNNLLLNIECINKLLNNEFFNDETALAIFNIIKEQLMLKKHYIYNLVINEEYSTAYVEKSNYLNGNISLIKDIIIKVSQLKSQEILKLKSSHNEYVNSKNIYFVKNFVLFSQSVYVMYILQLIGKNQSIISRFDSNPKLEEYIVDKLVDMNILEKIYNDTLEEYIEEKIDYSSLIQIPYFDFTPQTGKDLLQYLMYVPGKQSVNSLNYDENQKILVDAIFKIIYYEMAKKYTEEKIEEEKIKYIKLLEEKARKLDNYHNLSGFGDYEYKYYCGTRRKEIYDEIESIKSKDTSGFISSILGKYIYTVYENTNVLKELGREIFEIKSIFMNLCKSVLSDVSFNNAPFVVDKGGVTIYNIDAIKGALDEIVKQGGYGSTLEKVEQTMKLQYENNFYNYSLSDENLIYFIYIKIFGDFFNEFHEKISKFKEDVYRLVSKKKGISVDWKKLDLSKINEALCSYIEDNQGAFQKKNRETAEKLQDELQYYSTIVELQKSLNKTITINKPIDNDYYIKLSKLIDEKFLTDEARLHIENIKISLSRVEECTFSDIYWRICALKDEVRRQIISDTTMNSSKKTPQATDEEMDNMKDLCEKLGKSLDETIRLLSNENNFMLLLSLVASYDETLVQMRKGNLGFENMFSINPSVSLGLEKNIPRELNTLLTTNEDRTITNDESISKIEADTSDGGSLGKQLIKRLK